MALDPLTAWVAKGFGDLITKLAVDHAERLLDPSPAKVERIKTNLTPHIEATFKRCSTIKTLLNPTAPADFLAIYATQRFICAGSLRDQYGLVDYVRSEQDNVIVTGTGGSGKSMFTRYLWISLFVHSNGRVPLFIELRNLNTISKLDLPAYVFYTLSQGSARISEKDFQQNLARGDFVLILDGFDEISHERKEEVQSAIMALAQNYASTKIVVTSRPDGRFASWSTFHVVSVAPLTKPDVLELIERSEFDPAPKQQFAKKVDTGGLFDKHRSFLSNPLLASMMLLTFSHNFDIKENMHLFYEQAFDALYQRHDSHKPGGYKREFRSKLSEKDFKRLLAYFCLTSYYDQHFSFTRELALEYIEKASTMSRVSVDSSEFLLDLCEAVCVLVAEGIDYTFSHRSFQEYFAAYCVKYMSEDNFLRLATWFSKRPDDQVITLLADMNADSFRRLYVLPMASRYEEALQLTSDNLSPEEFYANMGKTFELRKVSIGRRSTFQIELNGEGELHNYVGALVRLSAIDEGGEGGDAPDQASESARVSRDDLACRQLYNALELNEHNRLRVGSDGRKFVYTFYEEQDDRYGEFDPDRLAKTRQGAKLDTIFRRSFMFEFIAARLNISKTYIARAREEDRHSADMMRELFGRAPD